MGLRARMERDLNNHRAWSKNAYTPKYQSYITRRIHLLEFALSGRYDELQKNASLAIEPEAEWLGPPDLEAAWDAFADNSEELI